MKKTQFFYHDPNAPRPNRPNLLGVVILVRHEDTVLMEHRADSDVWCFIGGSLETNESLKQCAIRELYEETGIQIEESQLRLVHVYDDPSRIIAYPDGNIFRSVTAAFEIMLEDRPSLVCSEESRELSFQKISCLKELPLAATHIPIMEDIREEVNK